MQEFVNEGTYRHGAHDVFPSTVNELNVPIFGTKGLQRLVQGQRHVVNAFWRRSIGRLSHEERVALGAWREGDQDGNNSSDTEPATWANYNSSALLHLPRQS